MSYIKNIIKVEVANAEDLSEVVWPGRHLCMIPQGVAFTPIDAKSPSSCEITDKIESNVRIFTSKLTFKTCEQIDVGHKDLAFRITTVDGTRYLLGRSFRPFPVLLRTENMPGSFTDSSLITYTVTWSDVVKPLRCL